MVDFASGRRGGDTPRRPGQTISEYYPVDDLACKSIPRNRDGRGQTVSDIGEIPSDSSEKVSQVRRRFNRIAPDFDRAVVAADFTTAQHLLLQQARELAWVKASLDKSEEPYTFRINLSALARGMAGDRAWLTVQHAKMVGFRVFTEQPDGSFHLNKDYRQWVDAKGCPRLSPDQVAWCLEALTLWRKEPSKEAKDLAGGVCSSKQGGVCSSKQGGVCSSKQGGVCSSKQGVFVPANTPPDSATIGTRPPAGAELNSRETNTDFKTPDGEFAGGRAGAHAHEGPTPAKAPETVPDTRPPECPPYPTDDTSALTVCTGAFPEDPEWGATFWRRLWLALGRPAVRANGTPHAVMVRWYEHQCWYPRDRWEAALRELVRAGVVPRGGGYLESIAGRPDLPVGSEEAPAPGATIPMIPSVPMTRSQQAYAAQRKMFEDAAAASRAKRLAKEQANASGASG